MLFAAACAAAAPATTPAPSPTPTSPLVATRDPIPSLNPTLGTFAFLAELRTSQEVPPVTDSEAPCSGQGRFVVRARLDQTGNITSATAQFSFFVRGCPKTTRITLAGLESGPAGQRGTVRVDSGLRADDPTPVTDGELGLNVEDVEVKDLAMLAELIKEPASYYLHVHSVQHASGLLRGQLSYER
jgi:hypothetical protein